ncbi:MAG TPA: M23 family metallopeptidase [Longimicrobiaceae bacterium]|nr:M23 family metallopeptidase [Longimicrobiaceae bacterium]
MPSAQRPGRGSESRDDRRMTFIVVPHGGGGLNTRSFEISYRRLRVAALLVALAATVWVVSMASWVLVAAQAARVPGLRREIAELHEDRVRVQRLAAMLERMERQNEQVRAMLGAEALEAARRARATEDSAAGAAALEAGEATVPSSWPLGRRGFVTREHLARVPGQHPGIDVAVPEGTHVRASGAGVVAEVGEDSVYGRYVRVRHRDGYETMYGHASQVLVERGARVAQDQTIALSGNTGLSTAPHLHFEVRRNGEPVDPRTLVKAPR